jgi:hypothetical protein
MKPAIAAGIALAALALAPTADAAKRGSIYDITKATGFERVTFTGDQNGGCELYNVCGYTGVVNYRTSGKPHGTLLLTRGKHGKVSAHASYRSKNVTTTRVSPPAGQGGTDCTETLTHKTDVFQLASRGSTNSQLVFTYHPDGPDYLDTHCGGPNEGAVADAGVLPSGLFKTSDFFRGTKPIITLSGATPFRAGGFSSTIDWKLHFKMKARACSPRCLLPKG